MSGIFSAFDKIKREVAVQVLKNQRALKKLENTTIVEIKDKTNTIDNTISDIENYTNGINESIYSLNEKINDLMKRVQKLEENIN